MILVKVIIQSIESRLRGKIDYAPTFFIFKGFHITILRHLIYIHHMIDH